MKLPILLISLFISAPLFAFDSFKSFPIEEIKRFVKMSTSEQLSHLESLEINLYKFSDDYSSRNKQIEIVAYLDEMPKDLLQDKSFNSFSGAFLSSRRGFAPNNTIILGSNADIFVFFHEVGHAFLEFKKIENKAADHVQMLEHINPNSELISLAKEEDQIDLDTLKAFVKKIPWSMMYLKEVLAEEPVVNYHLFNLLDLTKLNMADFTDQTGYLLSHCRQGITYLVQETDDYIEITSKLNEMIKKDKKLNGDINQTRVAILETIDYFDQFCIFNDESKISKHFDDEDKESAQDYLIQKQMIINKLKN